MAEPLNATFFALKRRDRLVLLPATIVFVLVMAVIVAAFLALNWSAISHFIALSQQASQSSTETPQMDEAQAMQVMSGFMMLVLTTFVFLFPAYLAIASYEAACLRWMIRGEAPGLFGITINADTWRVYGVYWCWFVLQFVVSFAMSIVMMPIMFMSMAGIIGDGGTVDPDAMMRWQLTVQVPMTLAQYVPLIFFGIRFGPAAATCIARQRFSFFEAWTVTRDRFFAIFGSYAVLWLIFGLVFALVWVGAYWIMLGDMLQDIIRAWPDFSGTISAEVAARLVAPQSLTLIGAAYAICLAPMLIYVVFSYGINARAALVALDEGKIEVVPPED